MKKASEIEVGDEFWHNEAHVYTVEEVYKHPANDLVEVVVRYQVDGGNGVRTFGYEQDVPCRVWVGSYLRGRAVKPMASGEADTIRVGPSSLSFRLLEE